MELMLMICLLGLTVLLGFCMMLILISGLAGRVAARLARGRPDQLQWQSRTKLATLALMLGGVSYSGYTAVYPPDSYYLAQFTEVSLRPAPPSSKVVAKSASYPDFHGDYCSYSKIELAPADFASLLADIEQDKRLRPVSGVAAEHARARTPPGKSFSRQISGDEEHHLSLEFMGDGKSVEVNVCVT